MNLQKRDYLLNLHVLDLSIIALVVEESGF